MIELMLGIILILILLTGTVQFQTVAGKHTDMDALIRGQTGLLAMAPVAAGNTPNCIQTWQPGVDGQQLTADDESVPGSADTVPLIANYSVLNGSDWQVLQSLTNTPSLELLGQIPVSLPYLGLLDISQTVTVPVDATAQDLFYNNPNVTLQESVWLPIMNGLH